ncbi:MAG: hypothetical protein QM770_20885 [Tepidisphaeraceae bacterium]
MPFDSGAISYTRFNVVGESPNMADEALLEKFNQFALREDDLTSNEIDYGWCGGRHVLDGSFHLAHNVYNDCVNVGLRIDTNKVPAELKKAYVALEETAAASQNPSGFASKNQKREAKESAARRIEEDLASGKFRKRKMIDVLWDVPGRSVYAAASLSQQDQLMELFERTHGLQLEPITAGNLALRMMEDAGKRREYEDLVPTRFGIGPGGETQPAEYPWSAKGDRAKDWLGNEFLMWLWHDASTHGGEIRYGNDQAATVMFAKTLDLDCAYGQTGRVGLKYETPADMPEAIDAIRSGKVVRKTGLALVSHAQLHSFSINAEQLSISGLKLPEVEEADSPRVLFEERITLLRDFVRTMDGVFNAFVQVRGSASWEAYVQNFRRWMAGVNKRYQVAVA